VGYKGGKDVKAPELWKADADKLVDYAISENGWAANQARRLLIERARRPEEAQTGATKVPIRMLCYSMTTGMSQEESDRRALHALRLFEAVDSPLDALPLIERLLGVEDPRIRAAAARIVGVWAGSTPGIPSLATSRFDQMSLQVKAQLRNLAIEGKDKMTYLARAHRRRPPARPHRSFAGAGAHFDGALGGTRVGRAR
jgi:hypothetical protein